MITNTEYKHRGIMLPNQVVEFSQDQDKVRFTSQNGVVLEITVLRDSAVRFRYATYHDFEPDFSYALSDDVSVGYHTLEIKEEKPEFVITTAKIKIYVNKENMKIQITDLDDMVINQDAEGFHWEENYDYGGDVVKMSKMTQSGESFYGMGDKASHTNLKGKRVNNWVTDQYAFGKDQEPLYKSIPFYIGLHNNTAYGIFFDNSFSTTFDFGHEKRNVTSFWADGGEMNYYFFYGPEMEQVLEAYTDLTGVPELPPLWALGFHQSKWSYYPEKQVRQIAETFRQMNIPCDAIYLDIDYMDGFRCFTWNNRRFPDPKRMVDDLAKIGFKTVTMIDPGIKIDRDYWVYNEAMEHGYFCRRADGPHFKGKVWPGDCKFPDFTNPEVREWWAGLYKEMIADIGVHGVWNDMNEPAIMDVPGKTANLDVRHDYDGNPCSHRKAHNIYGMQMVRATYEGLKKFSYPKRPFVLTRAAYAGTQRYCATWTGDNIATWEHLWIANVQIQRMCMSGYSFVGTDIGGFAEQPNGELFARWVQLGVFHPFCRVHSSGDHGDQEPWSFGEEVTDIVRNYINLRYQLMPYLYTTFYHYIHRGMPIIRSLVLYDQADSQTHFRTDEFMFGPHLLVCPIQEPNAQGRRMYIPRGKWYNYWTDEVHSGGVEKYIDAPIELIPLFVKEGAMIPKYPIMQYTGEKKVEQLEIDVYFKEGIEESTVYEDHMDGYDYKKGRYSLRNFRLKGKKNELIIQQFKDGTFVTTYDTIKMHLHGIPFAIGMIELDNERVNYERVSFTGEDTVVVPKDFTEIHLIGV